MKENQNKQNSSGFFGRTGRMGIYTGAVTLVVLAVLIFVNLIVSALPSSVTKTDTTANSIYTISPETEAFLGRLDTDVTLYYVCQSGTENTHISAFIERYAAVSDRIKTVTVDPVREPDFLAKYDAESLSNFSVIAVSDKRSRAVDAADMYYYYNEQIGRYSREEYQQFAAYYGAYLSQYPFTEYFDGDNLITGAVEYVTAEHVPTVYVLEGHNEAELTEMVKTGIFSYAGIDSRTLNIAIDDIPDDADVIFINAPGNDLTAEEAEKLIAFYENGGKIALITASGSDKLVNLAKVTEAAGMKSVPGTVSEGDSSRAHSRNAQYIYPSVNQSHDSTGVYVSIASRNNVTVLAPFCHGIELVPDSGSVALLTTSSSAFTSENSEKAQYVLAAAAEKGNGRFAWIASDYFLNDTFVNGTNGGNYYFFSSVFSWMQSEFKSTLKEVAAVDMSDPVLTVTEQSANLFGTVLIFVIPGLLIGAGLAIWIVRRRK